MTIEDKPLVALAPAQHMLATFCLMAAVVMVVLDQTIANVALPHIQATLGATPDSISWVLTSYILATAIGTPTAGWLSGRIGRMRLFGIAIVGFTISSALCGMATTLPMMVAARLAQGFCGSFLLPLSQSFIYDINAPSKQVRAITVWGLGVMVAPLLGPILGGYLTEYLDWRWVFFINVPIGALTAFVVIVLLPEFPSLRRAFDHVGFALIVVALCSLQLMLDRGTQEDWFESTEILIEAGLCVVAFWLLIFHLRYRRDTIIPTALFRDRSYCVSLVLAAVLMPVMVAGAALLPPLMQNLMGYPVLLAGEMLISRGVGITITMVIGARLMTVVDGRYLIFAGLLLVAMSLHMQTLFTLQMDGSLIFWSGLIQGAGLGFAITTLNYVAVATLPPALRTDGAALYSLVRSIGTSVMLAALTATLARNIQINHAEVGSAIRSGSLPFTMAGTSGGAYLEGRMAALADLEINRQAMMIAYINDFWLMQWGVLIVLPLVFLMKPVRSPRGGSMPVSE